MNNPGTAREAINMLSAAHRAKIEATEVAEVIGTWTSRTASEAISRMTPKHRAKLERAIR